MSLGKWNYDLKVIKWQGQNSSTSLESPTPSFMLNPALLSQSSDQPWASLGLHPGCLLVQTWENLAACFLSSGFTFLFVSGGHRFSTPQTLLRVHTGQSTWNAKTFETAALHTSNLYSGRQTNKWVEFQSSGMSVDSTPGTGGGGGQKVCRKKQLRSPPRW